MVVVVELVAGGTTTAGVVSTTGGAVSTTGAGVVASTVLWYEKHPVAIPHATTTAGIITIRLIRRIFLKSSIRYLHLLQQEAGQRLSKNYPRKRLRNSPRSSVIPSGLQIFPVDPLAMRLPGCCDFAIEARHDGIDKCVFNELPDRLPGTHVWVIDLTRDINLGCDLLRPGIFQ